MTGTGACVETAVAEVITDGHSGKSEGAGNSAQKMAGSESGQCERLMRDIQQDRRPRYHRPTEQERSGARCSSLSGTD
jgi:hypothetical protein